MVLIALPLQAQEQGGTVTQEEFASRTLDRTYQYNVYLPAGYADSDQAYPVIYLLHGRGDTMAAWLNVQDTLDQMIADDDIPPLIAIMPDMPSSDRAGYYIDSQYTGSRYHAEPVETAFFADLIPHVDSTYRTLAARESRLVGGYSMGGYGALRYSMAHPDMFAGALVLSPAVYIPLPPSDSSTREFGAFGKGDQLFDDNVYQSQNYPALIDPLQQSGLPLAMFIAVGDDEWKNPDPADRLHDLDMEAHMVFNQVVRVPNVSTEFRVYDGGHDWDVWQRGFIEGMKYLTRFIDSGSPTSAGTSLTGSLLGTDGEDYAGGVAQDEDGNTYLALGASGSVNGEDAFGEMDVALVKKAPDGSTLWTRQFGTAATERPYGLSLDSEGNLIVAGYTGGNLDGMHPYNGGDDAFVAKFDADGTEQWSLQFGDPVAADRAYGLAVAPDDQIYVAGYTKGALNGANAGDKDVILAQVSPQGSLNWTAQFGGAGEDKGYALSVGDDGTIYLAGVAGSGTAFGTPMGDLDGFLAAYSPEGDQQWVEQFGSSGWDEATGVTTIGDLIVVTGFVEGDFQRMSAGDKDIMVAAFDHNGQIQWSDQVGTAGNDKGAVVTNDGDQIFVAGYTDDDLAGSSGGFDVVLIPYASDGTRGTIRQIGTPQNDGADEYAEKNLFVTVAGDHLLLSGLTAGAVDGKSFGSGDVFLTDASK